MVGDHVDRENRHVLNEEEVLGVLQVPIGERLLVLHVVLDAVKDHLLEHGITGVVGNHLVAHPVQPVGSSVLVVHRDSRLLTDSQQVPVQSGTSGDSIGDTEEGAEDPLLVVVLDR